MSVCDVVTDRVMSPHHHIRIIYELISCAVVLPLIRTTPLLSLPLSLTTIISLAFLHDLSSHVNFSLPSLLMQAAASAASADGVVAPPAPEKPQAPEAAARLEEDTEENSASVTKKDTSEEEKNDGEESAPSLPPSINNVPLGGNSAALNQMLAGMNNPPNQVMSLRTSEKSSSLPDSMGEEQKKQPLRRGKWTPEEEAYANRLIQEFKAGLLPLTDGTTLRTFLSKLLNCDPMRISKKFVGSNCIGKVVFRRRGADVNNLTPEQVQQTRLELSELEKKFLDRVSRSKSSKSSSSRRSKSAGGMAAAGIGSSMNRSAAAAGRALLQSNKAPAQAAGGDGGLLAQLQTRQPGMFDNSTAGSYLANAGAGNQGGMGMANSASINNLMMQTGLNRDQIAQLASTQMASSASLANLLGKQRSFDGLMSLDFQSMQSIDNLANLIQAGMPNQVPKAEMRNMDWGSQGLTNKVTAPSGLHGSLNNLATAANLQGSLTNLVRTLSNNRNASGGSGGSGGGLGAAQSLRANQANANFGSLLPNNNLLQQPSFNPNANIGNLLQGIGNNSGGGGGSGDLQSLLQNLQSNNNANNAGNGTSLVPKFDF